GHNGQRPGDGHGVAAADRGVQQEHPRVLGLLVQLQNDVRCGGAQVHNHIAGLTVLDGLLHAVADDGMGGQDLEDHVAGLVDFCRVTDGDAACLPEGVHLLLDHIVAQHGQPALLHHVFRHRQSHDAHSQKSDFLHIQDFLSSQSARHDAGKQGGEGRDIGDEEQHDNGDQQHGHHGLQGVRQ
ncbi:hypothetical protein HHFLNI_HHFLNI_05355, partial [Dysosmobacter welbionis]